MKIHENSDAFDFDFADELRAAGATPEQIIALNNFIQTHGTDASLAEIEDAGLLLSTDALVLLAKKGLVSGRV